MKLHFKYNTAKVCKTVLQEQLDKIGLAYEFDSVGQVNLKIDITSSQIRDLNGALTRYGIEVLDDHDNVIVQKIKDTLKELANSEDGHGDLKFSDYLSEKFNQSYSSIAKVFSDVTLTSIERFYILHKIERSKRLISAGELTMTEIAWQLRYSSVQHLSNQFKKTTGITPTEFQRILKKRRMHSS